MVPPWSYTDTNHHTVQDRQDAKKMGGGMNEVLTQAQWLRVTCDLPQLQGLEDEHVNKTSRCTLPVVDFGNHISVFLQNQLTK